jgi:hypothetical protein
MRLRAASRIACALLACHALLAASSASAQPAEFSFGVLANPFGRPVTAAQDESSLREMLADTDADNLAFVVANGIKGFAEPCTDALYQQRKAVLDGAKNGLIVSLAGTDWADCRNGHGRSDAIERLNRIREIFFADDFSLGSSRIPLVRESATAKFHAYAENARWEFGNVMFATLDLPAPNNHYRIEAGRNSEFEDRLIANRDWLQRLFLFAGRKKNEAIVLFCDGDPLVEPGFFESLDLGGKRDGFAETRKLLHELAHKFPGKVLVVSSRSSAKAPQRTGIAWQGNLGKLAVQTGWIKIGVAPGTPGLFSIRDESAEARNAR